MPSGWSATTSDGKDGEIDRLRNLGQAQNYNINVDHGAHLRVLSLCTFRLEFAVNNHQQCPPARFDALLHG